MAFISEVRASILRAGIALSVVVGGLVLLSTPASAQITLVRMTTCPSGSYPTTSCTIPATGSGHLIVVGWASGWATTPTISSITDNAGNVYAEAGNSRSVDTTNEMIDIWYAKNSNAGATTLTITPNPTDSTGAAAVWEFAGVDLVSPLDQAAVSNSQPASVTPFGAPITAAAGEVIVSIMGTANGTLGMHAGNSFTNDALFFGAGWSHYFAPSAGTYAGQWDSSGGVYHSSSVSFKAAASGGTGLNLCDLNGDGVVNILDVNLIVSMVLGQAACTSNINGALVCSVVTVQRVVNASLPGGACVVDGAQPPPPPPSHSVTLNWVASSTPGVSYNLYRSTTSGGPYSLKLNASPVAGLSYVDNSVTAGQTYYYVVKAVDGTGTESAPSAQAAATVPTP